MRTGTKILFAVLMLLLVLGVLVWSGLRHGFSAREKPTRLETFLARHARSLATPAGAQHLKNPFPATAEGLAEGREHFADHCAICHGLDGSGNSTIGRNLYPPAPDMRGTDTQRLSDGELFYIISNGVRFTGMPAWSGEHSPENTWNLVAFIRHLPQITPDELKQMQQLAPEAAEESESEHHHDQHEHDPNAGKPPHEHH
jgi:mono/diheme cytochrome c family protein